MGNLDMYGLYRTHIGLALGHRVIPESLVPDAQVVQKEFLNIQKCTGSNIIRFLKLRHHWILFEVTVLMRQCRRTYHLFRIVAYYSCIEVCGLYYIGNISHSNC